METHILYALANKFNKESIIYLHGGHFEKDKIYYEDTDIGLYLKKMKISEERERSFNKMIESIFNSLLC